MRFLILADLHANAEALDAILAEVVVEDFDAVLVLGDFVGYGPDPNRVIDIIRALPGALVAVRGNHDRVACGLSEANGFNSIAAQAARWTSEHLDDRSREFLRRLDVGPKSVAPGTVICHGSPSDEDDYILGDESADQAFAATDAAVVFFGHTHLPSRFQRREDGVDCSLLAGEGCLELAASDRFLINPGSVGQPRDRDPRAAYMTYCTVERRIRWHRVAYPVAVTVEKIRACGLPESAASRLLMGE